MSPDITIATPTGSSTVATGCNRPFWSIFKRRFPDHSLILVTPVLSKARPCGLSSPEATTLTFFADLYAVTVPAYSSQTKSSPFGWKARSTGTFNPGMYVVTDPFGETRATRLAPVSATYRSPEASNARSWGAENPLAKRFTLPSGVILTMVPPDCSTAKRSPDGLKISPRGPASPVANTVYPIPETGRFSEPDRR